MHASRFIQKDCMKDREPKNIRQQLPNNRKQQLFVPRIYQSDLCFLQVLPLLTNDGAHSILLPSGFLANRSCHDSQSSQANVSMKYMRNKEPWQ